MTNTENTIIWFIHISEERQSYFTMMRLSEYYLCWIIFQIWLLLIGDYNMFYLLQCRINVTYLCRNSPYHSMKMQIKINWNYLSVWVYLVCVCVCVLCMWVRETASMNFRCPLWALCFYKYNKLINMNLHVCENVYTICIMHTLYMYVEMLLQPAQFTNKIKDSQNEFHTAVHRSIEIHSI